MSDFATNCHSQLSQMARSWQIEHDSVGVSKANASLFSQQADTRIARQPRLPTGGETGD